MGLDFDQLFPNRFLKAGEFQGRDVTLTISGVKIEELVGDKGTESKGIILFKETKKQLVLNKTNGLCLRGMFGRDTGAWLGKRVTLWPAPIEFGDAEIAIRVRGSPDLHGNVEVEIKLARKKPRKVVMLKTGQQQKAAPKQAAKPEPKTETPPAEVHNFEEPERDPNTGEAIPEWVGREEPPPFDPVTGEVLP